MRRLPVLLLVVLALGACGRTFQPAAALVNGTRIAEAALEQEVKLATQAGRAAADDEKNVEASRQVLAEMIQREILRQEAAGRGIRVTDADVDREFQQVRGGFPSESEFQSRLKEAGYTMASLRRAIADKIRIDRLRERLSPPASEAELRKVYQEQRERFRQVRVRHILFAVNQGQNERRALAAARAALRSIERGDDFAEVARRESDDPGSKEKGGLLEGWTSIEELDPAFGRAAWEATPRRVTGPVRSSFGYHLIEVLGKRHQPYGEVQTRLRAQLQQQSGDQALQELLTKALSEADIRVNPRYGDWDEETRSIVPHRFFQPAEPALDQNAPEPLFRPPTGGGGTNTPEQPTAE